MMRAALWIILAAGLLAGCAAPHAGEPLTRTINDDNSRSRLRFQREIAQRNVCANEDAFHLLICFVNRSDSCADYDARVQWLKERQMLPAGFDRPSDEGVTRGALSVAIARILRIKGGVALRALPTSERYATRELVYRGIYPPGSSPNQTYSGLEIIGILAKMEDFQMGDPANLRASELHQASEGQP